MADFEQYHLDDGSQNNNPNFQPTGSGTVLKDGDFQSPNYRPGQIGWKLKSDGSAEFTGIIVNGNTVTRQVITLSTTDQSTTSTTFVDITNATITGTFQGNVLLFGTFTYFHNAASVAIGFTVAVDGVDQGGTAGVLSITPPNTSNQTVNFNFLTSSLAPGTHTFKLRMKADGAANQLTVVESSASNLIFAAL